MINNLPLTIFLIIYISGAVYCSYCMYKDDEKFSRFNYGFLPLTWVIWLPLALLVRVLKWSKKEV